jgi:hypothetical protein
MRINFIVALAFLQFILVVALLTDKMELLKQAWTEPTVKPANVTAKGRIEMPRE